MFDLVVLAAIAGVIATLVFERNARVPVIFALLLTAVLSGIDVPVLEQVGVATRRGAIVMLAILSLRNRHNRPLPLNLLMAASVIGIVGSLGAVNLSARLDVALGILVLHGPTATVLVGWVQEQSNGRRLAHFFVWLSGLHLFLGALALRSFNGGTRFAGVGTDAPLYALTGAIFISVLLWALVYEKGVYRRASTLLLPGIVILTLLSGQRLGAVVAIAAAIPFIAVASVRWPAKVVKIGLISMAGLVLVARQTQLLDFSLSRLGSFDSNGREDRWSAALALFTERPVAGWGAGFRSEIDFGVHNSFVSLALEVGLIGLALWAVALLMTAARCLRDLRSDGGTPDLTLLASSWLLVSIAGAMVEDKLYRPTNLPAIVLVLAIGLTFAGFGTPPRQTDQGEPTVQPKVRLPAL